MAKYSEDNYYVKDVEKLFTILSTLHSNACWGNGPEMLITAQRLAVKVHQLIKELKEPL